MIPSGTVRKYDTYKDSGIAWIGEIPEGWNLTKYKFFARSGMGETILSEQLVEKGIPVYSATQEEKVFGYVNQSNVELKKGDLVIPARGNSIGCVTFIKDDIATCTQTTIYSKLRDIYSKFLYYYCWGLKDHLFEFVDTAIPQITVKQVQNNPVPLPNKQEQQKIADYLDEKCGAIDKTIETEEKVIEKLKEYKQSLITETVTKGLDKSAPMKDSGIPWIGQIPQHWEVKRLKRIATSFAKGKGITKEEVVEDGTVSCVRYGEIYSKYNNKFDSCFSKTKVEFLPTPQYFSYGDILFAGTGELIEEIGKNIVYVGKEQCLAGGDIIVLRHQENPIFLNYALGSSYSQAQKSYGKIKLKVVHISESSIGNILIALPTREEQKAIANYLDNKCAEIDKAIADKEQVIEKLTEYKKSLIYECVTGKRMVA